MPVPFYREAVMATRKAGAVSIEDPATAAPKSDAVHAETLLDEALAETFPASDPISPAYEARLEAAAADGGDPRLNHVGAAVATGLLSVGAVAALVWLTRSLARRQLRLL